MPTALIVDDEPQANELLAMLVQLRGYRTESAYNGSDALSLAARDRPEIVFLDLMLPDRSGYEVCRALRSSRGTAATAVVMVTARLEAENRIEGFRVGATEYIAKPYTPDQIFAAIDRADDWARRLASGDVRGAIPLDARAGCSGLPEVSRLAGLIRARGPSLPDRAEALVALALGAEAWGARRGRAHVATLAYDREAGRTTVAVRDESGWFLDEPPLRPSGPIAGADFPGADYDPEGARIRLTFPAESD